MAGEGGGRYTVDALRSIVQAAEASVGVARSARVDAVVGRIHRLRDLEKEVRDQRAILSEGRESVARLEQSGASSEQLQGLRVFVNNLEREIAEKERDIGLIGQDTEVAAMLKEADEAHGAANEGELKKSEEAFLEAQKRARELGEEILRFWNEEGENRGIRYGGGKEIVPRPWWEDARAEAIRDACEERENAISRLNLLLRDIDDSEWTRIVKDKLTNALGGVRTAATGAVAWSDFVDDLRTIQIGFFDRKKKRVIHDITSEESSVKRVFDAYVAHLQRARDVEQRGRAEEEESKNAYTKRIGEFAEKYRAIIKSAREAGRRVEELGRFTIGGDEKGVVNTAGVANRIEKVLRATVSGVEGSVYGQFRSSPLLTSLWNDVTTESRRP